MKTYQLWRVNFQGDREASSFRYWPKWHAERLTRKLNRFDHSFRETYFAWHYYVEESFPISSKAKEGRLT